MRFGDRVTFPTGHGPRNGLDIVLARGDDGRTSALLVHVDEQPATYSMNDLPAELAACRTLLQVDAANPDQVVKSPLDGRISFAGHGVAMLTTESIDP